MNAAIIAVSFMQELACNRLTERQAILLAKFEYAAHGFLPHRLRGVAGWGLKDCLLSEREEILFQSHTAGLGPREKACLDFRLQVEGNRHRILCSLQFTPASPYSKAGKLANKGSTRLNSS